MHGIPEATPIILTEAERTELLALARSPKTEYRLRQRLFGPTFRVGGARKLDAPLWCAPDWLCRVHLGFAQVPVRMAIRYTTEDLQQCSRVAALGRPDQN